MSNDLANKRLAKNTIFLSVRMLIVLAVTLYTTRVVLEELGVVDYGIYNVVCGFVAMFSFLNTSMSNGIQRFYNFEIGKNGIKGANKVYCTSIYIQAIIAVVVVLLAETVGLWYLHCEMVIPSERHLAAEWIYQCSVLMFVIGIMQAPFSAAVVAHEKLDFYAIVSVLDVLLKLGIVFILKIISSDKLIVYGILSMLIVILNISLYYVYCKRNFQEIVFQRVFDMRLFKDMIGFSGWNLAGSFSTVAESHGINLVINFFYGPIVNAARGIANQVNAGIQSFVSNITIPVRPQVTQSYARGDFDRTIGLTYSVSKISSAVLLMLALPAMFEINFILALWLGGNYPNHTAQFTILILCTSLINNLNAAISGIVHATGKMRDYQIWGCIMRSSSVPLSIILIKIYDNPELGLLAVLICAAATQMACLVIVRKLVGLSLREYFYKVIIPISSVIIISIWPLFLIHYFFEEGVMRLFVSCITSVVVVILLFFFIGFNKNERKLILELIKPIISKLGF